jgi:hypothetical protein
MASCQLAAAGQLVMSLTCAGVINGGPLGHGAVGQYGVINKRRSFVLRVTGGCWRSVQLLIVSSTLYTPGCFSASSIAYAINGYADWGHGVHSQRQYQ